MVFNFPFQDDWFCIVCNLFLHIHTPRECFVCNNTKSWWKFIFLDNYMDHVVELASHCRSISKCFFAFFVPLLLPNFTRPNSDFAQAGVIFLLPPLSTSSCEAFHIIIPLALPFFTGTTPSLILSNSGFAASDLRWCVLKFRIVDSFAVLILAASWPSTNLWLSLAQSGSVCFLAPWN